MTMMKHQFEEERSYELMPKDIVMFVSLNCSLNVSK